MEHISFHQELILCGNLLLSNTLPNRFYLNSLLVAGLNKLGYFHPPQKCYDCYIKILPFG